MRRLAMPVLAAALAALLLAGAPAMAVLPPPFQAAVDAFDNRLAQGSSTTSDVTLGQTVEKILQRYLEKDFPQNAPGEVAEAFVLNLILRFQAMTSAEVDAFRDDFVNFATNSSALVERCGLFFNVAAFATVADEATWQRSPGSRRRSGRGSRENRHGCSRRRKAGQTPRRRGGRPPGVSKPSTRPAKRRSAIRRWRSTAIRTTRRLPRVSPTGSPPSPRKAWVDAFERRLEMLYGSQGISVPPGFLRNLAQAYYVMTGWQIGPDGSPERVATAALRGLNDAIERGETLTKLLRQMEDEHGFRHEHPIPTRVLSLRDFSLLLLAGYMLNDVGVPLAHGELSHNIQWAAIMADYEANPGEYTLVPIQIFTGIGTHDAKLPALAGQRFGFERAVHSLWALVFDFPYPNKRLADFSHANGVRELIAGESSLRRLARRSRRATTSGSGPPVTSSAVGSRIGRIRKACRPNFPFSPRNSTPSSSGPMPATPAPTRRGRRNSPPTIWGTASTWPIATPKRPRARTIGRVRCPTAAVVGAPFR